MGCSKSSARAFRGWGDKGGGRHELAARKTEFTRSDTLIRLTSHVSPGTAACESVEEMRNFLIGAAVLHAFFMVAELFPWRMPFLLRIVSRKLPLNERFTDVQRD